MHNKIRGEENGSFFCLFPLSNFTNWLGRKRLTTRFQVPPADTACSLSLFPRHTSAVTLSLQQSLARASSLTCIRMFLQAATPVGRQGGEMEDKVMLLQYASICVLVGDQNEHKNKPYRGKK